MHDHRDTGLRCRSQPSREPCTPARPPLLALPLKLLGPMCLALDNLNSKNRKSKIENKGPELWCCSAAVRPCALQACLPALAQHAGRGLGLWEGLPESAAKPLLPAGWFLHHTPKASPWLQAEGRAAQVAHPLRPATAKAVYQFWRAKRKKAGKPLLRRLQAPTSASDTNPFAVFRRAGC